MLTIPDFVEPGKPSCYTKGSMTYSYDGWNYSIVLKRGEELISCLQDFIAETDVKAGWVSVIGGATEFELGFYDLEKKTYEWREFEGLAEITSLQGNISRDEHGKPFLHLHGTLSDETFQTVGGHVKRLVVGGTCEIFIHEFRQPMERQFDEETGLRTIKL